MNIVVVGFLQFGVLQTHRIIYML